MKKHSETDTVENMRDGGSNSEWPFVQTSFFAITTLAAEMRPASLRTWRDDHALSPGLAIAVKQIWYTYVT